jgi:glycosyltransferase involved in cell wall biosynthesis
MNFSQTLEHQLVHGNSLKILQINTEKTWRGGERQTLLTMKGLLDAGVDVKLLCLADYPLARRAARDSMPLILMPGQKQALGYLIKKGRSYDLLHAQTSKAQSLAVMSRPFHGRKIVYTRRVDFRPNGLSTKLKYRLTDHLVAISPAISEILESFVPGKTIRIIPSCVDTSRNVRSASEKALNLKKNYPEHKIVATIAAMVNHKDPLTMVRAVYELKKLAEDAFIFIHFGLGELEVLVRAEINRLGLEKDYLLMGFEDDVESFFPIFDVFVMSSQEEGLGSSVLEAFRYRVPVVSTRAGGLERLVSGRGLVCNAQDNECLAAKINELLMSPERYRDMVQKAQDYVLVEHSLEKMTSDYIRVYEQMLKSDIRHLTSE